MLANLRTLNLRGNQLSDLPAEITQLTNLEALDLSRNNFTEVPPELYELPALETVGLQNNPIPADEIERLSNHLQNSNPDIPLWLIAALVVVVGVGAGLWMQQRRRR
jgi:Leucine-rich repeat (LRR) protein